MNKMAKGAIATAAGVVLLIGGGGTLAVWNVEQDAKAGTIAAGDLNLVAGTGTWSVAGPTGPVEIPDISTYRVVPGDVLTYTQDVDITLDGNNLTANLTVTNPNGANGNFKAGTYTTSGVSLSKGGAPITNPLKDDVVDAIASVSFEFLSSTSGRDSVNATYDFSGVAFKLDQVAQ
jgi:alternate signal-mediated exported protein